ncbi:MAG: coiled-coil domain-containing protein [Planctomycetota bacterium]|jgi:hypothetical protein
MISVYRTGRKHGAIVVALIVAGAGLMTAPCLGQADGPGGQRGFHGDGPGGPRGFGRLGQIFQPDYIRRDIQLFEREFDLDRAQAMIVETLMVDYQSSFTEASEAMREKFGQLRPQRPDRDERWQERRQIADKARGIREKIRALRGETPDGEEPDPEVMDELRQQMETIRQKMIELRPPRPEGAELQRIQEGLSSLTNEWQTKKDALKAELEADLKSVLNEEQAERWPAFQRILRRQKTLGLGRLSGERVDLFLVVRELELNEGDVWPLEDLLERYAIDLDEVLVARNEHLDSGREKLYAAMRDGDTERAAQLMAPEAALRIAVRTVNEQYAEAMAAALNEAGGKEAAEQFRQAYRLRAFPRIYRPTRVQRAFAAARELDDLDETVLGAIQALQESYLVELQMTNSRLVQTSRMHEPRESVERLRRRAARRQGLRQGPAEDPIRQAFRGRAEMDDKYRKQLEALLTPEQVAALPSARPERGERRFDRGRGRGPGFFGEDAEAFREERRQRMLERFDLDGDGELSDEEREAARERFRQRRRDPDDAI